MSQQLLFEATEGLGWFGLVGFALLACSLILATMSSRLSRASRERVATSALSAVMMVVALVSVGSYLSDVSRYHRFKRGECDHLSGQALVYPVLRGEIVSVGGREFRINPYEDSGGLNVVGVVRSGDSLEIDACDGVVMRVRRVGQ